MDTTTVKNRLSKNLGKLMSRNDIRPCDLVRMCNHELTDQTISNILYERHEPKASVLCTISEALGITPDVLLGFTKRSAARKPRKLAKSH